MNGDALSVDLHLQRRKEELWVQVTLCRDTADVETRAFEDWSLKFDLPKEIRAVQNTLLADQIGSHVVLRSAEAKPLRPGDTVALAFVGAISMIQRLTDLPAGFYVTAHVEGKVTHLPVALRQHNLLEVVGGEIRSQEYGDAASADPTSPGSIDRTDWSCTPVRITPRPASITRSSGRLEVGDALRYGEESAAAAAVAWLRQHLSLAVESHADAVLRFDVDAGLGREAYRLRVDDTGIRIAAAGAAGFFYGAVSLEQLVDVDGEGRHSLPFVELEDEPRFGFRGFMLDCARHFHSKQTVLDTLDLMAGLKLNQFHWHLTDDEGWRVEIQAFPALTQQGAWRGEDEVLEPQFGTGPGRYGGFYSHDDIREVVAYAEARQITVIPEIDIPGHSRAAIKSCPQLLAEEADSSSYCSVQLYRDNVLNPALPGTYEFLHAVLDEICELFPGPSIHLGADEVPEGVWEQSPAAAAFKQAHGYETAHELQGHLFRDLQAYLAARGKQLMGWEEAIRGDKLDRSATVNAWTGAHVAAELANAGYRVVACAAPFAYLDLAWDEAVHEPGYYWAGTSNLRACYEYEPQTDELTAEGEQNLVGMQAVLWSELVSEPARLQYMLFPRLFALAETAWSPLGSRNWDDFLARLPGQLARLQQLGVNHRPLAATS